MIRGDPTGRRNRSMRKPLVGALCVASWVCALALAETAKGPKLVGHMTAFRVTTENGKEVFGPAQKVVPGAVIEYRLKYRNMGTGPARDVALVGPVPKAAEYQDKSASAPEGLKVTFSIDGGKSFHVPPIKYKSKRPDGTVEEKTAPPEMYTHVKWELQNPLKPDEAVEVQYRVKVK